MPENNHGAATRSVALNGWFGVLVTTLTLLIAPIAYAQGKSALAMDAKAAGLLDFIGSLEAPKGYDSYSYYASAPPPKPLTQMTIAQVLAWQDRIDPTSRSEAAGRFQIMPETLRETVKLHGVNTSLRFDEATQNRLGLLVLAKRGWHPDRTDYPAMANRLALEWAALPLVTGPNRGKSAYRSTKSVKNRAQTTPAIFLNVLKNGAASKVVMRAVKLSRTARRVTTSGSVRIKKNGLYRVETRKTSVTGGDITPSKVITYLSDPYQMN